MRTEPSTPPRIPWAGTSSRSTIPSRAAELGQTFDAMFANSGAETKTTTEKGFIEGFAKQIGDIGAITVAIASIVLFMFGLIAASTMVQSVRERTSELAVLKTLGFTDAQNPCTGAVRISFHHGAVAVDLA